MTMPIAHTQKWDLTSIPDDLFNKEWGRRRAAARTYERKVVKCDRCGKEVSATELRYRCPDHTPPAERGVVTVRRKGKGKTNVDRVALLARRKLRRGP